MRPEDLLRGQPGILSDRSPPLKACKACHKMIARDARTCPHCGKNYTTIGGVVIAIIIGLIVASLMI